MSTATRSVRPSAGASLTSWVESRLGEPVRWVGPWRSGAFNDVRCAVGPSGRSVAVRLGGDGATAARRADVLRRCLAHGVRVPEIRAVGEVGGRGVLVSSWIRGASIIRVEGPAARRAIADAGDQLARLHSLPVEGAGPLRTADQGAATSWGEALGSVTGMAWAAPSSVDRALLEQVARFFVSAAATSGSRFLHGDFRPEHVIVAPNGLTWLIDLDDAMVGDPCWDLATWEDGCRGSGEALTALVAGYRRTGTLGNDLARRLRVHRLAVRVAKLVDGWIRGDPFVANPSSAEVVRRELAELSRR